MFSQNKNTISPLSTFHSPLCRQKGDFMKKTVIIIFLFFSFFILPRFAFAGEIAGGGISVYGSLDHASFAMQGKWWNLDTVILPVGVYGNDEVETYFFQEFDYVPNTVVDILKVEHAQNTYSVPDEGPAVFKVQYADAYNQDNTNPPSAGYPIFILTHPNGSTQTYTNFDIVNNYYQISLSLEKGEYKYKYICTNDNYIYNDGLYALEGNWYVTSRPRDFKPIYPRPNEETLPNDTRFEWSVVDEENGLLTYELYLWLASNESSKKMYRPNNNSYVYRVSDLEHKRSYKWSMRITNKYGADLITDAYSFNTGGRVQKFYNAPNPFNPARGQKTQFVFNMPQDGTAKLVIYSEYGDKVYESRAESFQGGTDISKSIFYDGRDNSGKMLYNGTYIAILTKKYGGQTKVEKCRILIIK